MDGLIATMRLDDAFPGLFANFSKYFFSIISVYKIFDVFLAG
jgi:hypothetical protein